MQTIDDPNSRPLQAPDFLGAPSGFRGTDDPEVTKVRARAPEGESFKSLAIGVLVVLLFGFLFVMQFLEGLNR